MNFESNLQRPGSGGTRELQRSYISTLSAGLKDDTIE